MFLKSLSSVGALLPPFAAAVSSSRATAAVRDDAAPQPASSNPLAAARTTASSAIADLLELSLEAVALLEAPPLAGSQQTNASDSDAGGVSFDSESSVNRHSDSSLVESGESSPQVSEAESPPSASTDETQQTNEEVQANKEAQEATAEELTPEEQEQVQELSARDREVRTHEQTHLAVAGPYARGGPTYSYQQGPDGKRYAIGGEVQIDTAPVSGDPEATIRKAQVVRAAALAPAEPSSQDRAVAAAATKMQQQAQAELFQQQQQVNAGEVQGSAEGESVIADSDANPSTAANDSAPSKADRPLASKSLSPANDVETANSLGSTSPTLNQTLPNVAKVSPYERVMTAFSIDLWA